MNLKYFFTKEDCSCPLNSLSPEEIKKSYLKELSKHGIKKVRYLNLVSKTLGFQDWTEYQKEYIDNILPFLEKNGLKQYAPNNESEILKSQHGDVSFSYRQIADRIFLSNKPIPKKIFTGHSCKIDNFYYYYRGLPFNINNKIFTNYEKLHKNKNDLQSFIKSEIYTNLKEEQELDYLITSLVIFPSLKNLIGDTFIIDDSNEKEHIGLLYKHNQGLSNEYIFQEIGDIIHKQLKELEKGWIEIIPFNKNLVFLKAKDGSYDFVFRSLRDKPFISEFGKYIRTKNIPSLLNEEYDFDRWLYFGFKEKNKKIKEIKPFDIWLERDSHLAEIEYYKNNVPQNYPGQNSILKNYYTIKGIYSYYKKETKKALKDFVPFELEDKILYVSNLITIKDFEEFYLTKDKDNQSYLETRLDTLEDLSMMNAEDNENAPISVTWYDAIAYCRYIENKYNVHARLLSQDEFELICPPLINKEYNREDTDMNLNYELNKSYTPFTNDIKNELNFFYGNKQLSSPPLYMNDFENVVMKWAKPLEFTENNELLFCTNERFNEWTNEFRDGRSRFVSAKYYIDKNYWVLASSTMKYKYRKVGFRVCYETLKDIK
ncbi:hypothetical protein CP960_06140 [Malaciobacter halophilus]|uniref:Sulfatase-modifying factor enzyme domain-containing protein n=1 Tax=Malaciobacter halophilus TaxID=197482 RepID=A0A2N1J3J5_9BACT|nr:SUMF1/EgtB/PvdO family nonheme iron enzyme [Malaciobacter halophilus]AXH09066.1 hypothetical protein AHALO_0680 [Malaciobacter halophilus]PKI81137.1 hypothetical protein CP960_06140 [Malaciobacter halophilus]